MSRPLSSKANPRGLVVFFAIFALMGLGIGTPFFGPPMLKVLDARHWKPTLCVIESSSVGGGSSQHASSGSAPTYRVNVTYRYNVDGQSYTGTRYQFLGGSSSGRAAKAAIVARYPPGKKTTCYVNPRDPGDAVIERGFTPDMWFALIPLVFAIVGVWGMVYSTRAAKRAPDARWQPAALRHAADFSAVSAGARELKPSASPLGKLMFFLVFAVFWNGMISLMLGQVFRSWHTSRPEWGMALFSVPFVLVGIGMIFAVFYQLLALFNPRAHLRVDPGAVALGDAFALEWRLEGRVSALADLRISLEGSEAATYQNGKNTSTATNVFFSTELVNTSNTADFGSGRATATLPRDMMHSLDTGHNKIIWQLRVKGKIPRWPDLGEDYPLIVLPLRKEKAR